MMTRKKVLWATLIVCLGVVNFLTFQKENLLASGTTILLELAPRDPRSLIQGDYMSLRYRLAQEISRKLDTRESLDGYVIVTLDQNNVAEFKRTSVHIPDLEPEEYLLLFRVRGGGVKIATNAYYFEEGSEPVFRSAKYGELKVNDDGHSVLIGLRDTDLKRLEVPAS
ncbi:GDYXXLXY domain-containing protein [Hahella ganghwensis]|uniref:GDYXXLXY domain-containing protein n=1 Tax=Hahella ganghwensis TaxID=286420 RepID=UPI0012F816E6|nr:GDYXXLXY domain-containing protein [Hahella ganghwensis]